MCIFSDNWRNHALLYFYFFVHQRFNIFFMSHTIRIRLIATVSSTSSSYKWASSHFHIPQKGGGDGVINIFFSGGKQMSREVPIALHVSSSLETAS